MKFNLTLLLSLIVVFMQSTWNEGLVSANDVTTDKVQTVEAGTLADEPIKSKEFVTIWGLFKAKMWQLFLVIDYWGLLRKDWEYMGYGIEWLKSLPVLNMAPNFFWYIILWYSFMAP